MTYPGGDVYPLPTLYPNATATATTGDTMTLSYPGASSYPGQSVYLGGVAASGGSSGGGGGGTTPPPPGTPASTSWSSPGGELTVSFNTAATPPRAELKIAWPGATTVTITRTDPNGEAWPVRFAEPATLDASGNWSGFDPELPYGVGVTYTLTSAQKAGASPSVVTGVFDVPAAWSTALIHPQAPSLSVPIQLKSSALASTKRPARQASLVIMGRRRPVVVSDVRQSGSSQLVVWCDTLQQRDALDSVLADGSALRLACDARLGLDVPQVYIAVGDQDVDRPDGAPGSMPQRIVTLPFVEVDRPSGKFRGGSLVDGGSGFWTYATAQAAYTSYNAAQAAFATYADAALDRVR